MKKNDGYKKIKSLFYIVAIISMIIAIVGKVSAEEMNEHTIEYCELYLDEHCTNWRSNTSFMNGWNSIISECPYFSMYSCKINAQNIYFLELYGAENIGLMHFGSSNTYTTPEDIDYSRGFIVTRYNNDIGNGVKVASIALNDNSKSIVSFYYLTSVAGTSYNSYYGTYYFNCVAQPTYYVNGSYSGQSNGYTYIASYGSPRINIAYRSFMTYEDNYEPPSVDDNFIIYKSYGVGGISDPLLNIQYADDIFSQGYTYTSSTIYNLTFDVDGTETTVAISSSVYPDDFLENGSFRTSFDLIYRMLSNKIVNFSSADTVTLTAVSMSATAYPTQNQQGTPETVTKSTLCNLVLKGSQGSTDIESEVIPDITDVTIVYDQVVGSNDFHNHTGVYTPNQPVPSWADTYTIVLDTGGTTNHGAPWSTVDLYLPFEALSEVAFQGYTDPAFQMQGATYIDYNNLNAFLLNPEYLFVTLGLYNSCDVIRFVSGYWSSDGWLSDFDYIFYMQSYYTKLSIKGLGNIQSAIESGTYYTKSLYWYLKQRLDNMSDNIAEYEEKALSNQVVGNGYLQSINTNIISIKDSIDSGVNSIVSAISGISSGGSSYSLPSLSTELQRLFIPSLTWESIDFDEYMDSLGVLKIPFEMTNDVLDVTKASYSSTLDLHINDFEIDVTGNNDKLTVFEDQDYSFNPRSIFNNQAWTMLTYLNAFAVILAEAWFTYCHIFRREKADDR